MGGDLVGLFRGLVRVETELWSQVDMQIQLAHGVPLPWLEVMQIVAGTDRCRVRDIAQQLSITVGGASKVVDRVEAAGHCRRVPHPSDARSHVIELTEQGSRLLAAANLTYETALASTIDAALSDEELRQLDGTLRRLRDHLLRRHPEPAGALR